MRRVCGFVLFWIAVGMALGFYLKLSFLSICFLALCLILGYNLFCN